MQQPEIKDANPAKRLFTESSTFGLVFLVLSTATSLTISDAPLELKLAWVEAITWIGSTYVFVRGVIKAVQHWVNKEPSEVVNNITQWTSPEPSPEPFPAYPNPYPVVPQYPGVVCDTSSTTPASGEEVTPD